MRWLVLVFALLATFTGAATAEFTGRASVIDGDTIEIRGERIRLHGIDAPESGQWCLDGAGKGYRCGKTAAFALADQIGAQNVRCDILDRDRYGRHVARRFLGGADLNGWMVRQGQAVAYRTYSTEYVPAQDAARSERAGLWQRSAVGFAAWRSAHPGGRPADGCRRTCRRLPHQRQHQPEWQNLPPPRTATLRPDADRREQGRAVVLLGGRRESGRLTPAKR